MIKEFKQFISRGNVVELSVGIIIGSAFNSIVNSMVNDILMPLIGLICGGINFTNLSVTIGDASIKYGMFIQNVLNFLIVAYALFILVKALNKLSSLQHKNNKKNENEKKFEEVEVKKDETQIILEEIRDCLKEKLSTKKNTKKAK